MSSKANKELETKIDGLSNRVTLLEETLIRNIKDLKDALARTAMLETTLARFFVISHRRGGTWRADTRASIRGGSAFEEEEHMAVNDMVADMKAMARESKDAV